MERSKVTDGLEGMRWNLVINEIFNWKPVKPPEDPLKDGGLARIVELRHASDGGGFWLWCERQVSEPVGACGLTFEEDFKKKKGAAVVSVECNQDVNGNGGRGVYVRSRGAIKDSGMEIWRSSGIADVSSEC